MANKGRPRIYEDKARMVFYCEKELADFLTKEAKFYKCSRNKLLVDVMKEYEKMKLAQSGEITPLDIASAPVDSKKKKATPKKEATVVDGNPLVDVGE